MNSFAEVVEEVKSLNIEEKEELQFFLEKHLSDLRRDEIVRNHRASVEELNNNQIQFSSTISDLKARLRAL
jgi:hypothetical protein